MAFPSGSWLPHNMAAGSEEEYPQRECQVEALDELALGVTGVTFTSACLLEACH